MSQNILAVSRRVQLWLLGLFLFTIYIFWSLLPAVGIGLTVAAVCHPLYRRLYRFFQVSEKSSRTETIFATAITVAISLLCLFFLFIPFWILVGNIDQIKDSTAHVISFVERLEKSLSTGLGLGLPDDDTDQPQTVPATDTTTGDSSTGTTTNAGATTVTNAGTAATDSPPTTGDSAETPKDGEAPPGAAENGAADAGAPTDEPALVPATTATKPETPAAGTSTTGESPDEPESSMFTRYRPQMIEWLQGSAIDTLKAVPGILLKFFVFALTLYLGIRYGAMVFRRALFSLEIQTREILQRISTCAYRTLYAIYVVHFSTVIVTFMLAFPLGWVLGYEQVLMIATTCAIFQLIPFIGPTLIVVALMVYEISVEGNPNLAFNLVWLFVYGYGVMCLAPDWILRPYLMSKQSGINPLILWLGFFGGIAIMGPDGFVFGPLLLALLIEAVNIVLEKFPDPLLQLQKQKGNSVFIANPDEVERMLAEMNETEFRKVVASAEFKAKSRRGDESGRQPAVGASDITNAEHSGETTPPNTPRTDNA